MSGSLTPRQEQAIRAAVVAAAVARIGVREIGRSNTGRSVDAYLAYVGDAPGNPWCAAFASYCLHLGGAIPGDVSPCGYVPALVEQARRKGTLISAASVLGGESAARPGDLIVVWETYQRAGEDDYHHTGIVEVGPDPAGVVRTVEGNSNTSGSAEGYEVCRQERELTARAADGHARYAFVRTVG